MSIAVAEQKDVARTARLWLDAARLARRGSLSGSLSSLDVIDLLGPA
jgi:hypothetical protein